jgi:ribosomal-protein-alanine N-acetyltransferase
MQFTFRAITPDDVTAIVAWHYPAPYDFYDWDPDDDPSELLDPLVGCVVADDDTGRLAGFVCFGAGGQTPGGRRSGLYVEPFLDVGLGLRPDLTGRGLGIEFVTAALAVGRERFRPAGFRLSVAAFNERAIRVYERAGFVRGERFFSPVGGVETAFLLMRRLNGRSPEPNSARATEIATKGPDRVESGHHKGGNTTARICPACGTGLHTVVRHGVEIDRCPACRGVWLDRGELEKIVAFGADGGDGRDERPAGGEDTEVDPADRLATRRSFFAELFDVE